MNEFVTLPKLYTLAEVANYLGVSADTIRRECKRNQIGFTRIGGRIKFTEDQVIEYLQSQRVNQCKKKSSTQDRSATVGCPNVEGQKTGVEPGTTLNLDRQDAHRLAQMTFGKHNSNLPDG